MMGRVRSLQNGRVGVAQASMPKVDAGGESDGCGSGGVSVHGIKLIRAITSVKHHPGTGVLHRKPNTVNSTVRGFSRVRRRTEMNLVTKSGETRTLHIVIGVELEGKLVLPTWVIGKEKPLPTVIRVGV